jgi:hypothetical protein
MEIKTYHIVYCTKCTITKKWYIGVHSTNNLNDGYMGSGKILKRSIKKYGIENHIREVLFNVDTREEALSLEATMVRESTLSLPKCMNINTGGMGGNFGVVSPNKGRSFTETHKQKLRIAKIGIIPWNKNKKQPYTDEQIKRMVDNKKIKSGYKCKPKWQYNCPNGIFDTIKEAADFYKITPPALRFRIKSTNYSDFTKNKI